jgi:hypothetical protein
MHGKYLTQKEQFYIEKRRDDGVNQATITRSFGNRFCFFAVAGQPIRNRFSA